MKILLCIRSDYLSNFAGDSILIIRIAQYLKLKDMDVEINNGNISDFSPYDIIHLFNLTRISETYMYFKKAQSLNKKIVLTPVYWNLEKYYQYINDVEYLKQWEYYKKFRSEIISGCDIIYPSSYLEAQQLKREYQEDFLYKVVYCGVDTKFEEDEKLLQKCESLKPYILCVSRVCERKNQLLICQLTKDLGVNLVLIGKVNSNQYLQECLTYKNVKHLGFIESQKLMPFYKNAIFHILGSFVETPGLSNLEAGYCGCNIVSTNEGSAKEYFKDMALYLDPYDKNSISDAINKAICFNKQPELKKHIEKKFTWENCLNSLYESYYIL